MRRLAWLTPLLVLAACGHSAPFESDTPTRQGPFNASPPVRLTYNPNQDLDPRFLPELPAILYIYETSDATRRDRCLGLMPPTGGERFQEICPTSVGSRDSLDAYGPGALSSGGRLAYVASATFGPRVSPDRSALVVAPLTAALDTTRLHPLPFNIGGLKIDGVADLRWVDEQHLAYVGQRVDYPRACGTCKPDTVRTGQAIVVADLSGATPSFGLVGGPRNVTSLVIDTGGAFVYTLAGDTRVFRESPPGGAATVLFDFGSEGSPRDVDLTGDLMAAVVGPGILYVVDVATQTILFRSSPVTTVPPPVPVDNFFSHPVLVSPTQVVVEGFPLGGPPDLWLVEFRP